MATDIMTLMDNINAGNASTQKLFGEAGTPVRRVYEQMSEADKIAFNGRVSRALDLVEGISMGSIAPNRLSEAMGGTDFPLLMGAALDQILVGAYRAWPVSYPQWAQVTTVKDFRNVERYKVTGADGTLPEVGTQDEYPETKLAESKTTYRVKKYGSRLALTWEMIKNDALGAFSNIPQRFGLASARTEERLATGLVVGSAGPDSSLYTADHGNLITDPLSVAGVQNGFQTMSEMTDADGEPILNRPAVLAVPPALEVTADNIINALVIKAQTGGGGTSEQAIETSNWIKAGGLQKAVMPYASILANSNKHSQWYLFASPFEGEGAVEVAHLRGHEAPAIFMKSPNTISLGGAAASPFDGDFDTDSVQYKVRMVFGGKQGDYRYTVGSTGTGA